MHTSARREQILDWLEQAGQLQVKELVERFGVSEMTIRRDLEALSGAGRLVRTYGGAMASNGLAREQPYSAKATTHTNEKERIARRAAELIQEGDLVLLDSGSTTRALARELKGRTGLTVVTSDLHIALELCDQPGIRVLVTGGTAQPHVYNLYGPLAEQVLRGLTVDIAFLGTSAVDAVGGVTTPTLEKVPLKQAMIQAARRAILLADSAKFGVRAPFQICPLRTLTRIITDDGLPADLARAIRKGGVELDLV